MVSHTSTVVAASSTLLTDPTAISNPFYRLVPEMLLLPMVVLATCATVIASQAVITGAYSLTHQAIQLGLLPRLTIKHTSASHAGQIYIPRVTFALLIGVLLLVGLFRTSSALASAYGIAVATTMVVDGVLGFVVVWKLWQWPLWRSLALIVPFLLPKMHERFFFLADVLAFLLAWVARDGRSMVVVLLVEGASVLALAGLLFAWPLAPVLGAVMVAGAMVLTVATLRSDQSVAGLGDGP